MVWFQCEDCGENLKKPKLPNHFRICSASKLSCIDCGVMFGPDCVQSHTQCITEAEKYGPKGQVRATNGATLKPRKDMKQQPEFDINVGLSEQPPWFCSLCNTTATSKQTLLGHADGKKHRAKARAFHAAKQGPKQTEESAPKTDPPIEKVKEEFPDIKNQLEQKLDLPETETGQPCDKSNKKRKARASGNDIDKGNDSEEPNNGASGVKEIKLRGTESLSKKAKQDVLKENETVESDQKIKWKKLIKSALKSNPEAVLKMMKLKKLVLKSLKESGITGDEDQLGDILEQKVNSISRFGVDKKFVHLVVKD